MLTTLEMVIHEESQWPSYGPPADVLFPSLRCLRFQWENPSCSPAVAALLALKAPNMEELGVRRQPAISDPSHQLLSHFEFF